ncbi:putative hydrolase [Astathelohania contejeani]|uniref:Hydrolase n=1 Tax=Astathelohania contejeani TaxID=164912 RepID=A0ABQ7HZN3_9MICR|nr:putative hydrolase [Thelohania contejeani]
MHKLILLGTGSSSGVPSLKCLLSGGCKVCNSKNIKNQRTNTSMLIKHTGDDILIDCGKDFTAQYEKYIRKYNIRFTPHYVIITHPHSDAILGLSVLKQHLNTQTKLLSDKQTLKCINETFNDIFEKESNKTDIIYSFIPETIIPNIPITINDLIIEPFYVHHGSILCLGFKINNKITYISDCNSFEECEEYFNNLDLLIIDCNTIESEVKGHLNFQNIKNIVCKYKPKRTILTGQSHLMDYNKFQSNYGIEMGYDFMEINFN